MALMLTNKNSKELQRVEERLAVFCERNFALKEKIGEGQQFKLLLLHVLKNVFVKGTKQTKICQSEPAKRARPK